MKPPAIDTGRMNHIALPTADPERGVRFYRDVLGFVEAPRPTFSFRGAWLLKREVAVMVHLIHSESFREHQGPINSRTNHVAMQVSDYDRAVELLAAHGVEYVERVLPDYNYRQVFFRDPDGNTLELGEWPSPEQMFPDLASS
jgi:catechol 2,3-dioxygenase-like lactoylglutathione lyase family enzyme